MIGAGNHLDDNTKHVDGTTDDDSPLTADPVGDITGSDGTEEGTGREDGGDEGQVVLTQLGGTDTLDGLDEDLGAVDTVDVTGVVTEEDTTKGGEGAHEVGLPGDGGLNGLHVLGSTQRSDCGGGGLDALLVGRHDGG